MSATLYYLLEDQSWFILNGVIVFFIITLPAIILTLLFNREKNKWKSIKFGGIIGLISAQFWYALSIYHSIKDTSYKDYSFEPMIWFFLSSLFIGTCIMGALLSFFIRKIFTNKTNI